MNVIDDQIDVGGEAMKLLKVVPQGEQPLLESQSNSLQRDIYCSIYHLDPTGASEVKDADAGQEPEAESKAKAVPKRQVL